MESLLELLQDTGLYQLQAGQAVMMGVGLVLIYLAIRRGFEPLLLLPIGMGAVLVNIPGAGFLAEPQFDAAGHLAAPGGLLYYVYEAGIATGMFPLVIFMGVGAMADFGPMLANPKTLLLGAAAQFGIFATVLGAIGLTTAGLMDFSLADAAAIGIIGGADGPTAIFVASRLAPELLGAIAVAAYSYMALVPVIQPPIMRWLTTPEERRIRMRQLRQVTRTEKIVFPLTLLLLVGLFLPSAAPLLGMFCFGNLMRE